MTTTLYIDLETYCESPIKHGTYQYAEKCEVMLFAYAVDEGPVNVWDLTAGEPEPLDLEYCIETTDIVIAHNSMFDRNVLRLSTNLRKHIPLEKWRDTMVQAYSHSLPGSLDKLCGVMKVSQDEAKIATAKELLLFFCKPRPANSKLRRATRLTHPVEWQNFKAYAGSDILAMRANRRKLPTWNYK